MRRLTRAECKVLSLKMAKAQGGLCPLCTQKFGSRGGAVVDHCHVTGAIRAILCRTCNGGEGKAKTVAVRYGQGLDNYIQWLTNLAAYLTYHKETKGKYVYPSHKTEDEKRIARNTKARKTRAKETRAKIQTLKRKKVT